MKLNTIKLGVKKDEGMLLKRCNIILFLTQVLLPKRITDSFYDGCNF